MQILFKKKSYMNFTDDEDQQVYNIQNLCDKKPLQ